MTLIAATAHLSIGLVAVLVIVSLLELALLIVAAIDLVRRPDAAVRGHAKWPWALLIVFINVIGPLVYLAVGRVEMPAEEDEAAGRGTRPAADRSQAAVELLYGTPGEGDSREDTDAS